MKLTSLSFLALVCLLAACDPVYFSVEVEAREVCVSDLIVPFGPSQADASVVNDFSDGNLSLLIYEGLVPEIEVVSVSLTALNGVEDLSFVDSLMVEMASGEGEQEAVELVRMSSDDRMDSGELYREAETDIDITAYFTNGQSVVNMALLGDIPETPWAASMDLCLNLRAGYERAVEY